MDGIYSLVRISNDSYEISRVVEGIPTIEGINRSCYLADIYGKVEAEWVTFKSDVSDVNIPDELVEIWYGIEDFEPYIKEVERCLPGIKKVKGVDTMKLFVEDIV